MAKIKWRGSRSGYGAYRYGSDFERPAPRMPELSIQKKGRVVFPSVAPRVSERPDLAGAKYAPRLAEPVRLHDPAWTEKQLSGIVKRVADLLRDADGSPWGNESAVLAGLRDRILRVNWRHAEAEAEALDLIRQAFNSLGLGAETRPSFEAGQPQATIPNECCKRCGADLTNEDIAAKRHYCSDVCAAAAKLYANEFFDLMQARTRAWAHHLKTVAKIPPRHCQHCQTEFQPTTPDALYCSPRCSSQAFAIANGTRRKPKPCEHCGTPFIPNHSGVRFCSTNCYEASVRATTRICLECGAAFHPNHHVAKFCSATCRDENKKRRKREAKARSAA